MTAPYATGAPVYVAAGWPRPLPTQATGQKWPPVTGYTGYVAGDVDDRTFVEWLITRADANIILRATPDAVFVDRDTYKLPGGDDLWADMEAVLGPLPPCWRSSSRDGPSGKMPFRVPAGTRLKGNVVWNGVKLGEFLQWFHRYAVVWPSTNPDNGGAMERWWRPDGTLAEDEVPPYGELPDLPQAWLEHFADTAPPPEAPGDAPPAPKRTVKLLKRPDGLHPNVVDALERAKGNGGSWAHVVAVVTTCKQLGYSRDRVIHILQTDQIALDLFGDRFDHDAKRAYDRCIHHRHEHVGRLCSEGCGNTSIKLAIEVERAEDHLRDLVVPALGRNGEMTVRDLRRGPFDRYRRKDPYYGSAEWVDLVAALGVERGTVARRRSPGRGKGGRPSTLLSLSAKTSWEVAKPQVRAIAPGLQEQVPKEVPVVVPPNTGRTRRATVIDELSNAAPKSFQNGQAPSAKTSGCINVRCDRPGVVQSPVTGCRLCPDHAGTFGYRRRTS